MAIDLVDWSPPRAVLRIACGKGTYIRVLAEDIAGALLCCAHLAALRRTASGPFAIAGAVTLDAIEAMDAASRDGLLLPPDAPLRGMARLDVDFATARALAEGRHGAISTAGAGRYRCYGPDDRFLGLVEAVDGALVSVRLARTDDFR
jgi:tRNA pseudouridine55 synthase